MCRGGQTNRTCVGENQQTEHVKGRTNKKNMCRRERTNKTCVGEDKQTKRTCVGEDEQIKHFGTNDIKLFLTTDESLAGTPAPRIQHGRTSAAASNDCSSYPTLQIECGTFYGSDRSQFM